MSDVDVVNFDMQDDQQGVQLPPPCVIRVVGVGGCGCNTVNYIMQKGLKGVEFFAVNTDAQSLESNLAHARIQIGLKLTKGLGAGCDPNVGRKAAEESRADLKKLLYGSKLVFVTAGMGNGTGTGAASVIAEIAKEVGSLVIGVVTRPFSFEQQRKAINANLGITELAKRVDSLIVIDNNKVFRMGPNISMANAFALINDVLYNAVAGICEIILHNSDINVDFADVETMLKARGYAMIGIGYGQGGNFIEDAITQAIRSPLIDSVELSSASGLIAHLRVSPKFPIFSFSSICERISSFATKEADCKFGLSYDENLKEDQIVITLILSGVDLAKDDDVQREKIARATHSLKGRTQGERVPSKNESSKEVSFEQEEGDLWQVPKLFK